MNMKFKDYVYCAAIGFIVAVGYLYILKHFILWY